jgi:DNA-binding NtrC family response regulator
MRLRRPVKGFAPEALQRLQEYDWPGNIRELQNVIERAVVLTQGALVEAEAIVLSSSPSRRSPKPASVLTLAGAERAAIVAALEATGGRVSGSGGAAERLGLKPTTLHAKMKKLGIRRPRKAAI